jgi:hypothetical protein
MNLLAQVLELAQQLDESELLYREVLSRKQQVLGLEHAGLAATLKDLAGVLLANHKPLEAEGLFRRTVEVLSDNFGPDHPAIGTALEGWADARDAQGDSERAAELRTQAQRLRGN